MNIFLLIALVGYLLFGGFMMCAYIVGARMNKNPVEWSAAVTVILIWPVVLICLVRGKAEVEPTYRIGESVQVWNSRLSAYEDGAAVVEVTKKSPSKTLVTVLYRTGLASTYPAEYFTRDDRGQLNMEV